MKGLMRLYGSTIGKKIVIALTGLILFGFLIGHMVGNLKAYGGFNADGIAKLDLYAAFLREMGHEMLGHATVLWLARGGLLLALILHVVTIIQLQALNRRARPKDYEKRVGSSATLASRTMFYGGMIILLFIILHILHFTTGSIHFDGFVHGHVYANVYSAFSKPLIAVAYCATMIVIGGHLYHGLWSLFQTLGLDSPDNNEMLRMTARVLACVIAIGFMAVPLGIVGGFLPEPTNHFLSH